ncbi:MAG: HAD-IC family P-type ATPase [Bacilli bacterium]|nr:HAD-IC family P-type ATPase [Bacilli bacterium]
MSLHRKANKIVSDIKEATFYEVTYDKGLSNEQVKQRIEDNLVNRPKKTVTKSYFEIIFKNVFSILNILLFIVAGFMIYLVAFEGRTITRLFFLGILIINIGISLFQDIKARVLISRLSLVSSPRTTVIRDGEEREIPFNEIVLTDVIRIKAGDTIPCDATILHGSVRVNESLLSGEMDDVLKYKGATIYAESAVTSGYAYARVDKIGSANYASRLQEKARAFSRPKSQILTSLTYIIRAISIIAIAIGVAEMISYPLLGSSFVKCVDLIGSSVVAMIPIGMYLMTSITLTVGVILLSRRRMLVRELYSIEMLARVNVVCLDKTGTLTDGNMKVDNLISCSNCSIDYLKKVIGYILFVTKDDNLTAKALKAKYSTCVIKDEYSSIPFESAKKFSAASFKKTTYALGAFGFLKIDNSKQIKNKVEHYERLGYRVLLIAEGKGDIKDNKMPSKMHAIGIITFSENIKPDAKKNIDWFKENDASVRLISGDSVESLKTIAARVGIEGYSDAISLEGLNEKEVRKAVHKCTIFARVTPDQKKMIISELREMGNTVAMIGDGVNDLLALKSADCSIAMASGSDAVKAVSHLVSLDSNFSSLPEVVEQGRRVINNLQRVCSIFLVKTIFAMIMSTIFLCLPQQEYPFSTSNLLAWEVLTIGIAPFFIALEPNKERIKGNFIRNIIEEAIPGAITQIILSLAILAASYINEGAFPPAGIKAMAVIMMSVMSIVILLHVCMPLNKYRSIVLIGTVALMSILFVIDAFTPIVILDINYQAINTSTALLGLIIFIVLVPLYFLIGYLFTKITKKRKHHE